MSSFTYASYDDDTQQSADPDKSNLVRIVKNAGGSVSLVGQDGAIAVGTAKTSLKVCSIGDSITARDEGDPAVGLNGPRSDGVQTLAETMLGGSIEVVGIYATGGYTIEQVAETHLPTALASDADCVYVRAGVNNIVGNSDDGETVYKNLKTLLIDPILAAGKSCVVATITYSSSMTTANRGALTVANNMIRALDGTNQYLKISDENAVMSAAATGAQRTSPSTVYEDATHQNQAGAYWMALEATIAYKKLGVIDGVGIARKPVANAYGFACNPRLSGNNATGSRNTVLGTGISGTAPDCWNVSRSGSTNTAVCASVARTDGLDGNALEIAATITTAGQPINAFPAVSGGIFFRGSGASYERQNSTAYYAGQIRRFSDGRIYKIVGEGTTGASAPGTLPTEYGDVVADGTAVWMLLPDFVGDASWAMRLVVDFMITAQSGLIIPIAQLRQYASGYTTLSSGVSYYKKLINSFVTAGASSGAWGTVGGPNGTDLTKGYDAIVQNKVLTQKTPWVRMHAETYIVEPQFRISGAAGSTATVRILGAEIELAQV